MVADLRQEMFEHLLRAPTRYFDNNSSGQILTKFTYNVENVANATTNVLTTVVRDGFTIVGLVAYMNQPEYGPGSLVADRRAGRTHRRGAGGERLPAGRLSHPGHQPAGNRS